MVAHGQWCILYLHARWHLASPSIAFARRLTLKPLPASTHLAQFAELFLLLIQFFFAFSAPPFALSAIHFIAYFQHPPTSTTDLCAKLGEVMPWARPESKHIHVIKRAALHKWAARASPGTESMIYLNPVQGLSTCPRGPKSWPGICRCSSLAGPGLIKTWDLNTKRDKGASWTCFSPFMWCLPYIPLVLSILYTVLYTLHRKKRGRSSCEDDDFALVQWPRSFFTVKAVAVIWHSVKHEYYVFLLSLGAGILRLAR